MVNKSSDLANGHETDHGLLASRTGGTVDIKNSSSTPYLTNPVLLVPDNRPRGQRVDKLLLQSANFILVRQLPMVAPASGIVIIVS